MTDPAFDPEMEARSHPEIPVSDAILEPLRAICLRFPEAMEAVAFGKPTFQVRRKNFCMLYLGERGIAGFVKAAPGMQEAVIDRDPARYFRPPYLGGKGWIGCWLEPEADPDWDELADLIDESYRLIAPKRLVQSLDAGQA
ncbi:MAG: MmcQ/YjbR family DNA-binding protein [Thermomicrobiales bacterium]